MPTSLSPSSRARARHARRIALALGAFLTVAAACGRTSATSAASPGASTTAARPATRGNANLLTTEDLRAAAGNATAYDLVATLRPRWLQARGADSFTKPTAIQVYLGNARMTAGLDALRDIPALGIARMEWVDGISAAGRWGLDHGAGAIVVTSIGTRQAP